MSNRNILITGGAGFIGSNLVRHWCHYYPQDQVVVLDALTYAGNLLNLAGLDIEFISGDVGDSSLVREILTTRNIDTIAHLAAESHVDRSILEPGAFIQTNLVGTFNLLNCFLSYWQNQGNPNHYRFLHVSTDEVYGSLEPDDPPFQETTPYAPNSPYAASKAGSDHLVRAYFHTYGLPTLITNCSNNYGPYHYPEKLIPLITINILLGKPLPIYGDGQNIRDWLYVEDHCRALDLVIHQGEPGETYNIGGNCQITNLELVKQICNVMNRLAPSLPVYPSEQLITFVNDRKGHDRRYAIDSRKINQKLGWFPQYQLLDGLEQTLTWYLNHSDWWQPLLSEQYQHYYKQIYGNAL